MESLTPAQEVARLRERDVLCTPGSATYLDVVAGHRSLPRRELQNVLFASVQHDLANTTAALLEAGADKNALTVRFMDYEDGLSPCTVAAKVGSHQALRVLLAVGAVPWTSGSIGWTALHNACFCGHPECVKMLLARNREEGPARAKRELERELGLKMGGTPLLLAAQEGHIPVVQLLLAEGANIEAVNDTIHTPLHFCAKNNHPELMPVLIAAGANIEARNCNAGTPLVFAAYQGHHKCCKALLDAGADADTQDWLDNTPLMNALGVKSVKTVRVLAPKSNLTGVYNHMGQCALHFAALAGEPALLELLLAHVPPDQIDVPTRGGRSGIDGKAQQVGYTPLHCALSKGHTALVKILLRHGASRTALTAKGLSPLHVAATSDFLTLRTLLGSHGAYKLTPAEVNLQTSEEQFTALHYAVCSGSVRCCAALIAAGARIDIRSAPLTARATRGVTPLELLLSRAAMAMPRDSQMVAILSNNASESTLLSILSEGVAAPACQHCGAPESAAHKLKICSSCKDAAYCGPECSAAAWPAHKAACKRKKAILDASRERGTKTYDMGMRTDLSAEEAARVRARVAANIAGGAGGTVNLRGE